MAHAERQATPPDVAVHPESPENTSAGIWRQPILIRRDGTKELFPPDYRFSLSALSHLTGAGTGVIKRIGGERKLLHRDPPPKPNMLGPIVCEGRHLSSLVGGLAQANDRYGNPLYPYLNPEGYELPEGRRNGYRAVRWQETEVGPNLPRAGGRQLTFNNTKEPGIVEVAKERPKKTDKARYGYLANDVQAEYQRQQMQESELNAELSRQGHTDLRVLPRNVFYLYQMAQGLAYPIWRRIDQRKKKTGQIPSNTYIHLREIPYDEIPEAYRQQPGFTAEWIVVRLTGEPLLFSHLESWLSAYRQDLQKALIAHGQSGYLAVYHQLAYEAFNDAKTAILSLSNIYNPA